MVVTPSVQILSFIATGMPVKSLIWPPELICLSISAALLRICPASYLKKAWIAASTFSMASVTAFAISVTVICLFFRRLLRVCAGKKFKGMSFTFTISV